MRKVKRAYEDSPLTNKKTKSSDFKEITEEEDEVLDLEEDTLPAEEVMVTENQDESETANKKVLGRSADAHVRKITRKKAKFATRDNFFEMIVEAKKIFETLRRGDITLSKKQSLAAELHELLKGKYEQVSRSHDTARIVQWVIKFGKGDVNLEIFNEIQSNVINMVQQKYASHCIKELLERGGKKVMELVIKSLIGHTYKLLLSKYTSSIMIYAYTEANESQKMLMQQDLYGDVYKLYKSETVKDFNEALAKAGEMKDAVLRSIYTNVISLLNKDRVHFKVVHTVTLDLLKSNHLKENSPEWKELHTLLKSNINKFLGSVQGAMVAMHCLWNCSAKERKDIMKSSKEFTTEKASHLFFMAMFDCVDDTVLLSKIVIEPLLQNCLDIAKSEHSNKMLQYLLVHRDTQFFHPEIISMLKEGDKNPNSKKAMDTRRMEISKYVLPRLLENFFSNPLEWMQYQDSCMVVRALFKAVTGDAAASAFEKLVDLLMNKDLQVTNDSKSVVLVEDMFVHKTLRTLIANDSLRYKKDPKEHLLSTFIVKKFGPDMCWWLKINRAAFLLVCMLETDIPEVEKAVLKFLAENKSQLVGTNTTGTKILLEKLNKGQLKG